ncbi:unnamed protein product [Brachionus calyciflorus]|uniref:Serine aminopeptidase S33 domain-containing protein n=1 Tax=Brachionus calyciflorus TaxID=104777 RepID=A0A813N351_9BILA|nr:unnamed protein product [Brachionus calyciflorus]
MSFLINTAKFILYFYFFLYAVFHFVIYKYPNVAPYLIFQNTVKWPFTNLSHPIHYGLENVHNFYFQTNDGLKIGVWHYLPDGHSYDYTKHSSRSNTEHLKTFLSKSKKNPVLIYVHGNDRDRSTPFRIELCKNLVNLGFHVFALDYRGYGDSAGYPTEMGVVSDVLDLYKLILTHHADGRVYLYGHSLGTAIVCHASKLISNMKSRLDGVILEAPLLNASRASRDYHVSLAFNNNKWIQQKVDEALESQNIHFRSDMHITEINSKILIMHAKDDTFVPYSHGEELYNLAKKSKRDVKLVSFEKDLSLGHFLQSHLPIYDHIKEMIKK